MATDEQSEFRRTGFAHYTKEADRLSSVESPEQRLHLKSQIGKAMAYAYARWDALSAYLHDGNLQIDNNLCENAIRPVALGRKNYLFAGSHEAAQRSAMIYSFFAICRKHEVNPFKWLKHTLLNISAINHKNLKDLYPQNYKQISDKSNM